MRSRALRESRSGLAPCAFETVDLDTYVGQVAGLDDVRVRPDLAAYDCRNNRLAQLGLEADGYAAAVAAAVERYGAARIGVFMATSTSGILETELAYRRRDALTGALPADFHYGETQNTYSLADFVRRSLGLEGPAFVVSSACSASATVFGNAVRMIAVSAVESANLVTRKPKMTRVISADMPVGEDHGAVAACVRRDLHRRTQKEARRPQRVRRPRVHRAHDRRPGRRPQRRRGQPHPRRVVQRQRLRNPARGPRPRRVLPRRRVQRPRRPQPRLPRRVRPVQVQRRRHGPPAHRQDEQGGEQRQAEDPAEQASLEGPLAGHGSGVGKQMSGTIPALSAT